MGPSSSWELLIDVSRIRKRSVITGWQKYHGSPFVIFRVIVEFISLYTISSCMVYLLFLSSLDPLTQTILFFFFYLFFT